MDDMTHTMWNGITDAVKRLNMCPKPHNFNRVISENENAGAMSVCSKCGGMIPTRYAHWYELGLEDGRKDGKI